MHLTPRPLSKDELEPFPIQPGYHDFGFREACCNKIRIVGPLLKLYLDVLSVDGYKSGCIYEVPEDVTGLGRLIAVADLRTQQSIKAIRQPSPVTSSGTS